MPKNKKSIFLLTFLFFTIYLFSLFLSGCIKKKTEKIFTKLQIGITTEELIFTLENNIPKIMKKAMIPGLSIAVIREGELLWTKGFGVKNTESKEPVTDETIFEAASFSKPVYAYAVLKLMERGDSTD